MKKIEAVSQTRQLLQEQYKSVQKTQGLAGFSAVGCQFQKKRSCSKKNGRKDKIVADITLEKSGKAGKSQSVGQQPKKREYPGCSFFFLMLSVFWQQELNKEQRTKEEYAAADETEQGDPVHGMERGLEKSEKE